MEESTSKQNSDTQLDPIPTEESKEELRSQHGTKQTQLPRHPNKMVAERTSDMYFSGLMTE